MNPKLNQKRSLLNTIKYLSVLPCLYISFYSLGEVQASFLDLLPAEKAIYKIQVKKTPNRPPAFLHFSDRIVRLRVPAKLEYGTGFFISPRLFVTSYHVIEQVKNLRSISLIKKPLKPIKIKRLHAVSISSDLAVFETKQPSESSLLIGSDHQHDSPVFVAGYLGKNHDSIQQVTSHVKNLQPWSHSHYTIPFNSITTVEGMSGSPLLNSKGQVLGILFMENRNYKSFILAEKLSQLLNNSIGTLCGGLSFRNCQKAEFSKARQIVLDQMDPYYEIKNRDNTFFHIGFDSLLNFLSQEEAKNYLLTGAKRGDPTAQFFFSFFTYSEKQSNHTDSVVSPWMALSAAQGYPPARLFLELL